MSSFAAYAIEMGFDPVLGPDWKEWSESAYRRPDTNREIFGDDSELDKVGYDTPIGLYDSIGKSHLEQEVVWFSTAKEAFRLAKDNPGSIVRRSQEGDGFNVFLK